MESTIRVSLCATVPPAATVTAIPLSPGTLLTAFSHIPDPRRVASVVYPLASLLAMTVSGLLANQPSVLAIAEWAARQSDTVLAPLGLRAGQTPCQSTLQRLLVKLDSAALSDALSTAMAACVSASDRRGSQGVAIDGKAQRGRLQYQSGGCQGAVRGLSGACPLRRPAWDGYRAGTGADHGRCRQGRS